MTLPQITSIVVHPAPNSHTNYNYNAILLNNLVAASQIGNGYIL
jgi:hypothetical protein